MSKSISLSSTIIARAVGVSVAALALLNTEDRAVAAVDEGLSKGDVPVAERIVAVGKLFQRMNSEVPSDAGVSSQFSDFSNFSNYSKTG